MIRNAKRGQWLWYHTEQGDYDLVEVLDVLPAKQVNHHPVANIFLRRISSPPYGSFWSFARYLYRKNPRTGQAAQ